MDRRCVNLSSPRRVLQKFVEVSGLVAAPLLGERLHDGQVFMEVLHGAPFREVRRCVPVPSQDPLGGEQPLQPDGASGVDTPSADADLCSWRQRRQGRRSNTCAVERSVCSCLRVTNKMRIFFIFICRLLENIYKRWRDKTTPAYRVRSGSRRRNVSSRSRKHKRCPAAAGTAQRCPLEDKGSGLVPRGHNFASLNPSRRVRVWDNDDSLLGLWQNLQFWGFRNMIAGFHRCDRKYLGWCYFSTHPVL